MLSEDTIRTLTVLRSVNSYQLNVIGVQNKITTRPSGPVYNDHWLLLLRSLPDYITSASLLTVFRPKLKTRELFRQSHPDIIL